MRQAFILKSQLRNSDVRQLLGGDGKPVSRTTFWRMLKNPKLNFPKGHFISERIQVWDSGEVLDWLESRKAEAIA